MDEDIKHFSVSMLFAGETSRPDCLFDSWFAGDRRRFWNFCRRWVVVVRLGSLRWLAEALGRSFKAVVSLASKHFVSRS